MRTSGQRARLLRALLALCFLLLAAAVQAQTYQWRDVVQEVEIRPNGDVFVSDTRTLWTNEDFGEAFLCLDLRPPTLSPDLRITVTYLDTSGALGSGPTWRIFRQSCDLAGGGRGVELVVRNDRRISERRVRFDYILHGSVKAYSDVVEWYWNLVELDHPVIVGYRLTVTAPGRMSEPFDAYVHTRGNPEVPAVTLSSDRSRLSVAFDRIPRHNGVEIRYMMDPDLFEIRGTTPGHEMLLRDEMRLQGIEERMSTIARIRNNPYWGLLALFGIGTLGSGVLRAYNRGGREPKGDGMLYPFEPPSDLPPAALPALQMQRFSAPMMGPAMHATIMDLARKGYAEFDPKGRKINMRLDLNKSTADLLPFEVAVLNYLKGAARGKDPAYLEFSELKSYSESRASTFLPSWGKSVRAWLERERGGPLVEADSLKAARRWSGRSLLVALGSVGLAFALAGPASAMFIGAAVLSVIIAIYASAGLPRWREEVGLEVQGWQGFKRTLTDYTQMKDAPPDFFNLWDKYFVYAAALGVADKYLREIKRAAPLAGVDEATMVRHGAWMGGSGNLSSSMASFSSLASSVSSLSSALSSASGSASSGGSSSGGGGGGGGGGSSGGR
ncbi:MAG: DUF2207 domain-containing protein [Trueperaceae bacterium]|nr:DUF2207 domain-containing protein [Trueperaceae bacterium]